MEPEKTPTHTAEGGSHEHGSHEHKTEGGGLLTGRVVLGLLVALSLGFGMVMAKKYIELEAKVGAGLTPAASAPAKDPETEKALNELGKKLGAIKSELDELEPILKKLGVKVEKKTAGGPHGH
ncbi:MAG TPA: hypothetical protein ACFYD3_07280 [Candidatus Hypogeohydataceae bacterium YC41]